MSPAWRYPINHVLKKVVHARNVSRNESTFSAKILINIRNQMSPRYTSNSSERRPTTRWRRIDQTSVAISLELNRMQTQSVCEEWGIHIVQFKESSSNFVRTWWASGTWKSIECADRRRTISQGQLLGIRSSSLCWKICFKCGEIAYINEWTTAEASHEKIASIVNVPSERLIRYQVEHDGRGDPCFW